MSGGGRGGWMLLLGLVALAARAEPQVLLAPAVGGPARLTVSGRVLKARPTTGRGVVGDNLRALTASEWPHAEVTVGLGELSATVEADGDGDFRHTFLAPEGHPFAAGWTQVFASVRGASASARALVLGPDAPFLLVSDLDDTLAVTGVTSTPTLVRNTLGADATTQAAVPGMADFYRCLWARQPAPGLALVSGSPIQYLPRVARFLELKGFPPMALELRRVSVGTLSGYKPPALRRLLEDVPAPVVLVGDAGEKDPEVYRQVAQEHPGRVKAIYIRKVGPPSPPQRFDGMLLFEEAGEAARDAAAKGLADEGCVEARFPR